MIPSVYSDVLTAVLRYVVPGLSLWLFARCACPKGKPEKTLWLLTALQALLALSYFLKDPSILPVGFLGLMGCQWLLFSLYKLYNRNAFETEILCFFLTTFGFCGISAVCPEEGGKQLAALLGGVLLFMLLGWVLQKEERICRFRPVAVILGGAAVLLTLFFGETYYGAKCWLTIGGVSVQPPEMAKLCFLFAGATAPKGNKKAFFLFLCYGAAICLCLALMNDFGTALIFFFALVILSFLQYGSLVAAVLCGSTLALAGITVRHIAPHALDRFSAWRHIWESPLDSGYQQTRALMCMAGGGLLGLGAGRGWMKNLFAADSDMILPTLWEEWGFLPTTVLILAVLVISLRAVKKCSPLAVSAAAVLLFQTALNALGAVDILPLTGVTFPFVSNGGSALICAWGLMAFIQGVDT